MTGGQQYLIDANTLITPKLTYYPMDLVPSFWDSMAEKIKDGSIVVLDVIRDEIVSPSKNDDLSQWLKGQTINNVVRHNEPEIVAKYQEIIKTLETDSRYDNIKAVKRWSAVADPWLVAAAAVYGYTIVTFEKYVSLTPPNPCSKPKIPNFANEYNIRVIDLYRMIRELCIKIV